MQIKDQICILCRGTSMAYAEKYFHDLSENMIIVNEFNEELKSKFVQDLFNKKNITHIVSRDTGLSNLKPEYYEKYNIKNVILNIFKEEYNGRSSMRNLMEKQNLNVGCLSDSMKPYQKDGGGFPTTGIISIVYATIVLGMKDIHIAGMDFYEKGYFANIIFGDHQRKKGVFMKKFIENFMRLHPKVKYTFYTNSSFTTDLKNVTIVKEE